MDHDEHIDNHFDGGANITLKRVSREPSGEGAVLFIDIVDINGNDCDGGGGA